MLRALKWMVLSLLTLLIVLFLIVAGAGYWAGKHPERAWAYIQKRFLPADLDVRWRRLEVHGGREGSWRRWSLDIKLEGLEIKKRQPRLDFPVERVHVELGLTIGDVTRWLQLRELQVEAPLPLSFWAGPPTGEERNYYQLLQTLTAGLSRTAHLADHVQFGRVRLDLEKILYYPYGGEPLRLSLHVNQTPEQPDLASFDIGLDHLSEIVQTVQVKGQADLKALGGKEPFLAASIALRGRALEAHIPVRLISEAGEIRLLADPEVSYAPGRRHRMGLHARLTGMVNAREVLAELTATLDHLPGPLLKLSDVHAQARMPLKENQEWSPQPTHFKVTLPIALFFIDKNMRKPFERSCRCRIPEKLEAQVEGDLWPRPLLEPSQEEKTVFEAALKLEDVKNRLIDAALGAQLAIHKKGTRYAFAPRLDSRVVIESFQGLRQFLDAKNIMIPAPLNVLDGKIRLDAHGPVGITRIAGQPTRVNAASDLDIDLHSKNQVVKVHTQALFKATSDFKTADVGVHAHIAALKLELPPLDPIAGLPRLTTDPRLHFHTPSIAPAPAPPPPKFKLYLHISAETDQPGAIRLLSKYASPWVPISLKVEHKSDVDLAGLIRVEPFEINYLRRRLYVDALKLDLSETDDQDFPIDANFHVNQTEYKVMIHVGGTLHAPEIQLSSDPYLDRNDIISVLLYDRTTDQLVGGDAETAGNVQAAMADRAIGLFGLWAFATTPIRSFAYNPVTKVYSATVELGRGLTAGIGTTWEQSANFEVRKRLSKRWVLTATWNPSYNPDQEDSAASQVVLQWEKRF